tara:strand:- start:43 stop:726 length:684 start_codon:yes stop_codon:yes gene_type:complete
MGFINNIFKKNGVSTPLISSKEFQSAVKEYFAPQLREKGWKGTGFNFYKDESPLLLVLSFIPNKYGGSFYVEIGIHYSFVTDIEGQRLDTKNLKTYKLDFRRRLKDAENNVDWKYPSEIKSCSNLLEHIWSAFITDGEEFFSQFKQNGEPWLSIKPADLDSKDQYSKHVSFELPPDARSAWLISQILGHYGRKAEAIEMAKYGLSRINPPQGQALINPLNEIINKYN